MTHIAVIGLGQIGGSIVLALRRKSIPYKITGIDTSRKRLRLLQKRLDATATSWKAAEGADLVVLCLQYQPILEYLRQAKADQLVIDVCSGKEKIVRLAKRRNLRFIGGHPLAGNEHAGEKGWRQDLFEQTPFFISPAGRSRPVDVAIVRKFITALGAYPVKVDPAKHDRYLAMTSHFPTFLSAILRETSRSVPSLFRGPGYRSMIRLSRTPPESLETFIHSNRSNILKAAILLRRNLDRWLETTKR